MVVAQIQYGTDSMHRMVASTDRIWHRYYVHDGWYEVQIQYGYDSMYRMIVTQIKYGIDTTKWMVEVQIQIW